MIGAPNKLELPTQNLDIPERLKTEKSDPPKARRGTRPAELPYIVYTLLRRSQLSGSPLAPLAPNTLPHRLSFEFPCVRLSTWRSILISRWTDSFEACRAFSRVRRLRFVRELPDFYSQLIRAIIINHAQGL